MGSIWQQIGFIRWPLTFSVLVLVALVLWTGYRVFGSGARPDARTKVWIDAILFWGGFAAVTGVLGTLLGIIVAAQSIEAAGAVSAALVWGGIKVALLSSALGMLIMIGAGMVWFFFQLRWRLLGARRAEAT